MILLIVVALAAVKFNDGGLNFPYKKKTTLFTPVERNFLQLLEVAIGDKYRVVCRVKLGDVLQVRKNTGKQSSRQAQARASSKYLDFVLCAKEDLSPMVAIDLVHLNGKVGYKSQRDWFVNGALESANIPHLRIKVKPGYKPQEIRECIEAKLNAIRYKEPQVPLIKGTTPNSKTGKDKPYTNPIAA
jgi:hypothetical protein